MSAGWLALADELALWPPGRATLWWRDDDARIPTPELARLLAVGRRTSCAPLLAAVPRDATMDLADAAALAPGTCFAVHGWAHVDHGGARKCELGPERPLAVRSAELAQGLGRLRDLLGPPLLPVLVPPWNRLGNDLVPALPALGFRGLSGLGPRPPAAPLPVVNVHVDLVDWKARAFRGADACLATLVQVLSARHLGQADRAEPTGLMSHHLVHGPDALGFLEDLLGRLQAHPSVRVLMPAEVFPDCSAADRLTP